MGAKLHKRFIPYNSVDQITCATCDKKRSTCAGCNNCNEHCSCEYCWVCGEPNHINSSACLCFTCAECGQKKLEAESNIDDGRYENDSFDPSLPYEEICTKCYGVRHARWLVTKRGVAGN